jgi:hypothetical protein
VANTKKPRKTVEQKLDLVVLRAMDAYGCHRQTSEQLGWSGVQAHAHIAYQRAQKAIRRILREARRG